MRAYLLGVLDDQQAERLEGEYFADPEFFRLVRARETALIEDYLNNRLDGSDRQRFESRYLVVPELRNRLEEVRLASAVPSRRVFHGPARLAAGFALLLIAVLVWSQWRSHHESAVAHAVRSANPQPPMVAMWSLTPGVEKGGLPGAKEFTWPAQGHVHLTLELPGRGTPVQCQVRLNLVNADATRSVVWTGPAMHSKSTSSGQQAEAELDAGVVRPGDYVAEVIDTKGTPFESYVFRVNPAP